jgi:hypothetical protein
MTALEVKTIVGLFATWKGLDILVSDGPAKFVGQHSDTSLGEVIARRCKDPSWAESLARTLIKHDEFMQLMGEAPVVIGREKK